MADKKRRGFGLPKASKSLKDMAKSVQTVSDDIYTKTYSTPRSSMNDLEMLRRDIDTSLDNIVKRNMDGSGRPNISSVYTRLINMGQLTNQPGKGDNKINPQDFETIFEDQVLMDAVAETYAANTYIKQYDAEIDLICKYMPKLEEALEIKKDTVLFADQFNKDYLSVRTRSSINYSQAALKSEMDLIKEKYNIPNLCEEVAFRAWKYGEDFLYIVPYEKAFRKIFGRRAKLNRTGQGVQVEAVSFTMDNAKSDDTNAPTNSEFTFNVTFNSDNALTEHILRMYNAVDMMDYINDGAINDPIGVSQSIIEAVTKHNPEMTFGKGTSIKSQQIIPDDTVPSDIEGFKDVANDGLISNIKDTSDDKTVLAKIPGCLVKRLDRSRVIPIYIEDMCMGYYYLEIENSELNPEQVPTKFNTYMDLGRNTRRMNHNNTSAEDPVKQDDMLKKIVAQLSGMINKKFINDNQDLSRELYMILKYDETFNRNTNNIKITYIPPEDLQHIYFKMNPKTHRGISLFDRALIPAKIYIALSMSYAVGILTRGQDKRVYYVKQQVETNISKTLLNAINQIKKGNFGVRNMENLMSVLNITGQYNDYFIPRSPSGESPIDFEVLQGQDFNPNMEFLQQWEEYAVGTTGVPIELISSRQSVDYALQLTMTNSKHIRIVYKDQAKAQAIFGTTITKIHNAEFGKKVQLMVMLPPPLYISMTNTSQLVTNALDFAEKVIKPRVLATGGDEQEANIAADLYVRQALGTYMDFELIDEIIRQAKMRRNMQPSDEE